MAELPVIPALLSSACVFGAVFLGLIGLLPVWDQIAERRVAGLVPRLVELGVDDRLVKLYMRLWGVALFGTFIVFGIMLGMLPVAIGLVYLVFVTPSFVLDYIISRREQLLRDQMVRVSVGLANAARAGMSLPQGLQNVAADTPKPMDKVLKRIVQEYKSGMPLSSVLTDVRKRLDLESFTMFSSAITVCLERGGKITYALERISETLHEVQRVERKLETDSASNRTLALALGLFPVGFLLLFSLLDPDGMHNLYHTLLGQCVLLFVGALIYVAVRWAMAIVDIDV